MLGINYSIDHSSIFLLILGPKRLQNETRKFQKIIKIPMFVAKWSFWHPLADFGLHFCSPGCPFWLHYGRWGCCFRFTLLDRVHFWPSVLIVTAFTLHFNPVVHRNARTCSSSLKSLISPTEFCRRSVLSVTRHYFHVHTCQRRGRRDSRSANNSILTGVRIRKEMR